MEDAITAGSRSERNASGEFLKSLLVEETTTLRYAVLVNQVVGRVLFAVIIVSVYLGGSGHSHRLPVIVFVAALAGLWLVGSLMALRRTRSIQELIAETAYPDDHQWGALYIRSYYDRYQGAWGKILSVTMLSEPILWGILAIWALVG
jgi:hypothetical protein